MKYDDLSRKVIRAEKMNNVLLNVVMDGTIDRHNLNYKG